METWNKNDMKENGIDVDFVQDNQSMSTKGVLRGLHFQKHYPQCKLVRAVRGTVFDVAVDLRSESLRSESKTYGKWYGVELSDENKKQFLIPEGFAHGFLVLSDEAEFCYKVNDFWHPNDSGDRHRVAPRGGNLPGFFLCSRLRPGRWHPAQPLRQGSEVAGD